MPSTDIKNEIERFREKLLDLTNRNPLLNYRKSSRRTVEIIDELPDEIYKRLVVQGKAFKFDFRADEAALLGDEKDAPEEPGEVSLALPSPNSQEPIARRHTDDKLQTNLSEKRLESVLKSISREAKTAIEETGINYLHLAIGFLHWSDSDSAKKKSAAPLLLIPLQIERNFDGRSGRYVYTAIWTEEEVRWNLSLAKRIERDFGLRLPEFDPDSLPESYFISVSDALKAKSDWQVQREALVGFFSFHKLQMYEDIAADYWHESGKLSGDSLATQIILGTEAEPDGSFNSLYAPDYEIDGNQVAESILLAQEADSSQHSALCDIASGKSLVIEGPPGTGKSQTITNAIAMALHDGKRVLFVAEKLAALEVVQRKLEQMNLGELCLEVHSDVATARRVFESLRQRLERTYRHPNDLQQLREEIEQKQAEIASYLAATEQICKPYDEPLYDLLWRVIEFRSRGIEPLREIDCETELSLTKFKANSQLLGNFVNALNEFPEPTASPWWGFHVTNVNPNHCDPVDDCLAKLAGVSGELLEVMSELTAMGASQDDWHGAIFLLDSEVFLELASSELSASNDLDCFLAPHPRSVATEFVHSMRRSEDLKSTLSAIFLCDFDEAIAQGQELKSAVDSPLASHFRQASIDEIDRYRVWLNTTRKTLEELLDSASELEELGHGSVRSLEEFEGAFHRLQLFRHPIVEDASRVKKELFLNSIVDDCRKGVRASQTLASQQERLEISFHLASVPGADEVTKLLKSLRPHITSWTRFLNSQYRSAVRELKTFWRPGIGKKPAGWVTKLEGLLDFQNAQQRFSEDPKLSQVLGDLFEGHKTDWERVKELLDWVATAKKHGLDAQECRSLLDRRDSSPNRISGSSLKRSMKAYLAQMQDDADVAPLGIGRNTLRSVRFSEVTERIVRLATWLNELSQAIVDIQPSSLATLDDVFKIVDQIQEYKQLQVFISDRSKLVGAMGAWYAGDSTDCSMVESAVAWCEALTDQPLPPNVARRIVADSPHASCGKIVTLIEKYRATFDAWNTQRTQLGKFGNFSKKFLNFEESLDSDFACGQKLQSLKESMGDLPAWSAFSKVVQRCSRANLSGFVVGVLQERIAAESLVGLYQVTVLNQIAETTISKSHVLSEFSRQEIENARSQFQGLDKELTQLNREKIAYEAAQTRPPGGVTRGRVAELTEMGLIRHEIQKQQRHCRIRELLARAGNSVQALKPCFMMSPLSVAQYIAPGAIEFDLVVMDEASQIKPEDALGTLLRAKQIVVVGDPKQLPPTSFFDRTNDEVSDEEATQFDNSESILEATMKSFQPMRRLRWHYRSQHESLIQFSNHRFYDDDLVVFPSPTTDAGRLGVRLHEVPDASFSNGENMAEAQAVANAVVEHVLTNRDETLGVGAFNMKQTRLIQELIDKHCESDSRVRHAVDLFREKHEDLFVKNLENLQGDERDVIFISYTYGPDPQSGRVMNRFGPMNGAAGWRRLNVLITRARKRVEVFSSMLPSQITGGPDKSKGVNALKDYLEFAATGKLPDRGTFTGRAPDSPFEVSVARVVESFGLEAVPQVGVAGYFIDIGVRRRDSSGEFILGIECDGATYHSSKSARDRDRLREEVIRSRGWNLHRIWSTDWFLNQRHEEDRLQKKLEDFCKT